MIPMDKKRIVTIAGTLVLAGAVVAAGVYGPSVWKVFRQTSSITDQVTIQSPPVNPETNAIEGTNGTLPNSTAPPGNVLPGNVTPGAATPGAATPGAATPGAATPGTVTPGTVTPTTAAAPSATTVVPQGDSVSKSKYREPDTKLMELAPSVTGFFGENALSNDAKTLAFGTAWNIHQYVDGYLFGPAAGPQLNEQDIKKYIVFHKTLWDKQLKNEPNASKAAAFTSYLDVLLNTGTDAFDSKDKTRIEQFHQGIHDLDTHLMRNDVNSKIYGATPFATKRS